MRITVAFLLAGLMPSVGSAETPNFVATTLAASIPKAEVAWDLPSGFNAVGSDFGVDAPVTRVSTEASDDKLGYFTGDTVYRVRSGNIAPRQQGKAEFTLTSTIGLLDIKWQNGFRCHAIFLPAANVADMQMEAHTCGDVVDGFTLEGIEDGKLRVTGVLFTDLPFGASLEKEAVDISNSDTVRPSIPLDFAGVEFGPTIADIKSNVAERYTPLEETEFEGWRPVEEGSAFGIQMFYGTRTGQEERERLMISSLLSLTGEPRLIGFSRLDTRPADQQATLETLKAALVEKYGPVSREIDSYGRFVGMTWSFAPDGTQLFGSSARSCTEWFRSDDYLFKDELWFRWGRIVRVPGMSQPIPARRECGVQIVVRFDGSADMRHQPEGVSFAAYDASSLFDGEWDQMVEKAESTVKEIRDQIAQEAADRAADKEIDADL